MNMPGFNAQASIYKTGGSYRVSALGFGNSTYEGITPAYRPGPGTQAACGDCFDHCARNLAVCEAGAAAILAGCFFPPACPALVIAAAAAEAACTGEFLICGGICEGTDCCPKLCGVPNPSDPGSGCCDKGEACVDQDDPNSRNGCCPSAQHVCNNKCCPPGVSCCGSECGCPANFACVQGQCCPPSTTTICNGACCQGPCDINGNCCDTPNHLCGGACCPPLNDCCNGQCCDLGQHCHPTLGTCCSTICGPACCAANQFCQDPSTGHCGGCPAGQHACNVFGAPQCCPDGTECCSNGQCCPPDACCIIGLGCLPKTSPACTPR